MEKHFHASPSLFSYFFGWQISLDGQPPQPQEQPDFFRLRRFSSAPVTAAATKAATRILPQFSLINCSITYTLPMAALRTAALLDCLTAGRNSRYSSPASRITAAAVNTLKDTAPETSPPS